MPHAHLYHALLPVIFWVIWFLDLQVFQLTTFLNNYIPLLIRILIFIAIFSVALVFIWKSHKFLFQSHEPPNQLISGGIFRYVRNPMYLGILIIYISLIFLNISLISIVVFIIVYLVYNKMVDFEEDVLEARFGEKYKEYQRKVPKWIPNPFKK